MSLKQDLQAARRAQKELADYCDTLPKGSEPTEKYYKLNNAANKAAKKLPLGMRSLIIVDLLGRG